MRKSLIAAAFAAQALLFAGRTEPLQAQGQSPAGAPSQAPASSESIWDRLSVTVSGLSYHIGGRSYNIKTVDPNGNILKNEEKPFNEVNPGIGLEYRLSDRFHVSAGTYENSKYRRSWYASAGMETNGNRLLGAGIDVGIVSGYRDYIVPTAVPYVRVGALKHFFNLKLGIAPSAPPAAALYLRLNPF